MDREQLEAAIAAQESLRGQVTDDVVDTTVDALRRQLAALDVGGRRRRQVSLVFADVSGFTALAETLDAEDVTDVMNEVWDRLDTVVAEYGGRIDKHIGDELMAVWGADVAREDDPERAVRAALGLQAAMGQLRADTGSTLRIRVGVNTGPVLLGAVGSTGEFTAMGDAVNLASRLEHAAPVDGVLISHDTYRHVKGVFTVRVQPPIHVKGKRRPVRSYLVEDVRPRAFRLGTRGVEGIETRMVGRDAEMELLRTLLVETLSDGAARSVCVVGDAGLGKSRLLYEFEDWLHLEPTEVRLFKARADQQHTGEPLFLIRDLLFSRFGIAEDESPEVAVDQLISGVRELVPAIGDREVGLLAAGAGLASPLEAIDSANRPPASLEQMSAALAEFVRHAAADLPVVVLLEDLHWADELSLDAVDSLMRRCTDARVFMILLSRPGPFERHPVASRNGSHRIELTPLDEAATRALAAEVLQNVTDLPVDVLDEISATAAGNPFFVEELVKVMVDDEVIAVTGDDWTLDLDRLVRTRAPTTITAVLDARLDRLSSRERAVLERAAVVGRTFWDEAISSAVGRLEPSLSDPTDVLASLEAKELVFRQLSSRFLGTHQYIFKHALLHEVAYERVLKGDRARLHREIAQWLIGRDNSDMLSATVSAHYDAAGDTVEAARWHARAGRYAARRSAPRDAVAHLTAARHVAELDDATRLWVLGELSRVLTPLARHAEGVEVAAEMFDAATELDDTRGRVTALLERSCHLVRLGRLDDALASCEQAAALSAAGPTDPGLHMRVRTEQGWILLRLGRTQEAIDSGETAIALADGQHSTRDLRNAHSQLGAALQAAGALAGAEHHLEAALRMDQEQHNTSGEAADLINLGVLASYRDDPELAVNRYEAALRITRTIGDVDQEALALNNLGSEHISLAEYDLATTQLTEAVRLFETADAAEHTSETHCLLARAQLGRGETERALARAQLAWETARSTGSPDHLGNACLTLGAVAGVADRPVAAGDAVERPASAWIAQGIAILTTAGLELDLAKSLHQLAQVTRDAGDPVNAHRLRRRALQRGRGWVRPDGAVPPTRGD